MASVIVGDFEVGANVLADAISRERFHGRHGYLARLLMLQAWAMTFASDWRLAGPAADEAELLAGEAAQPAWQAGARAVKALSAVLAGDEAGADALTLAAEQVALPMGAGFLLAAVQMVRGLSGLANGRHDDAYEHLIRIYDVGDPAYHQVLGCWAIGDLAEAAALSGHRPEARKLLAAHQQLAELTPSPWLHAALAYAAALLADDPDAEGLYLSAIGTEPTRWPIRRGRLLLAYGRWLRRQRRVGELRAPLRASLEAFEALGLVPFAACAREELRASGQTRARKADYSWDQLSSQEREIAQLASSGLSNREIGQRLYVSDRTVGSHLYRLFPKLGVTSRSQLRDVMEAVGT